MYLEANEAALEQFRELCSSIDCQFETKDSFVYSLNKPHKIDVGDRSIYLWGLYV